MSARIGILERGRSLLRGMVGVTAVILAVAVAVRGIQPERPQPVEESGEVEVSVREPLQFLQGGAHLRIAELDELVTPDRLEAWRSARRTAFSIQECPTIISWLETAQGQALERELGELRRGTSEEALGALALILQLARVTEWEPGFMGGATDAERLGGLLSDWLQARADGSVDDPVLHEPALAAMTLYGRTLRIAYQAPILGRNDATFERSRGFLSDLAGVPDGPRTTFGRELQARYSRAVALTADEDDPMLGLAEEAKVLFPGLDGGCEE